MNDGSDDYSRELRMEARRSRREEAAAVEELRQRLGELTPRIPATVALIVLNVAAFATLCMAGVSPVNPSVDDLIVWGANFGPLTAGGQWWRLFASMFLHIGVFHLAMNMWALSSLGRFVERMLGSTAFLAAYLLSGWVGALVSVSVHPFTVSAGASGAIFGVYGVLLAFIVKQSRSIPVRALRPLRNSAVVFIGVNLWIGITSPKIDLAAHVGGFVGGIACGLVLVHDLSKEARRARQSRIVALVAIFGAALAWGTSSFQGRVPDLDGALREFAVVEKRAVATYNAAAAKAEDLPDDEVFADIIDREILPPWRAAGKKLAGLRGLPDEPRALLRQLQAYHRGREEAWAMLSHGLRAHDSEEIARAQAKDAEVTKLAEHIGKP